MSPPFELLERIPQALHPLDRPPPGPGWNHAELADLLPAGLPLRQAAVLVALVERPGGPQVLLTRRTEALRHHAGQIAFPGGRIENSDADPVEAAAFLDAVIEMDDPTALLLALRLPRASAALPACSVAQG